MLRKRIDCHQGDSPSQVNLLQPLETSCVSGGQGWLGVEALDQPVLFGGGTALSVATILHPDGLGVKHPDGLGTTVTDVYTRTRMADIPDEEQLSRYFSMIGKKGGKARFARMTPEERKAFNTKASKAAAKARTARAKKRKKKRR